MIVAGPHGVNVGSTGGFFAERDFVYAQCEAGQVAAIVRGDWVVWSYVNNTAVAGIMQDTRGLRVIHTTTASAGGVAGCMESAYAGQTDALSARVLPPVLCQVYGFHGAGKVTAASALTVSVPLATHTVSGSTIAQAVASTTAPQAATHCGFTLADTINGTQNQAVFVRCM
jgi:hypothetical protein